MHVCMYVCMYACMYVCMYVLLFWFEDPRLISEYIMFTTIVLNGQKYYGKNGCIFYAIPYYNLIRNFLTLMFILNLLHSE